MRKKINVTDVRLGMYVDEVCGNWMDSPFWKSTFRLERARDLKTLRGSGIRQVWIDTGKGADVEASAEGASEIEVSTLTDEILTDAAENADEAPPQVFFEAEIENARNLQNMAVKEVTSMFNEVRMGKALRAENAIPLTNEIYRSVVRNPGALINLTRLKTKDDYTYMHSVAVCALMIALGRQMQLDSVDVKALGMAGLLHDVGKMAIPNEILNKPDKLTDIEFERIKTHPERGWEMLRESAEVDAIALDVCLHHHERVDGQGYPEKLDATALSLFAKMGAVCDVYDAITSNRAYKSGWSPSESLRKMASWKEGHFDEKVFDHFVKTIGIYPVGSLLKLRSGRLGVVIDQACNLLKPRIKVFYSTNSGAKISPQMVDLEKSADEIESVEDPARYGFDLVRIMG